MAGNGYVPSRNILDALDKEKEAEKIREDLQAAQRKVVVENYNARQSTKHARSGSGSRTSRESVSAAQREVKALEKQLETTTGVNNYDRIGLTASGAAAGMGASYAGAGGTLMKGADSLLRSGTDADIVEKRGEIIAQKYNTRQNEKRHGVNDQSARESIGKLQQELQEITAAKEAEAMEKQLGLMKAASALDAEYERLSRKSASDIGRAKLGTSGVGSFLIDAGVVGAQIVADAAAKAVANAIIPGASIVLKGVRSFGDASQEARKAGASIGQQVTYGGLTAGKDMFLEKTFDKLGGIYGKGALDEIAYAPQLKESVEEFASTLAQPLLRGVYNEDALDEYDMSMFKDTLRNAAIAGVASGAISAWDDAQNWALDKAYDMATSPQIQARIRKSYASTPVQSSEESYAALLRMLYNRKGDGHRW